jgi:hypothetical protein
MSKFLQCGKPHWARNKHLSSQYCWLALGLQLGAATQKIAFGKTFLNLPADGCVEVRLGYVAKEVY